MNIDPPADMPTPQADDPIADAPIEISADSSAALAVDSAPVPPEDAPIADAPVVSAPAADVAPAAPAPATAAPSKKHWYVVKVQSGREDTIRDAIERRVKIEGLERFFGQVVVPMERETVTIKSGKRAGQKTVKKRKKFPGYVMAEIEFNEEMLYLFRDTSGVGDFVGASPGRPPLPMSDREVQAMLRGQEDVKQETVDELKKKKVASTPTKLPFGAGDKVRVRDGTFQGLEGDVESIKEPKDAADSYHIRVKLTVFGRPTTVQFEHWQVEPV